MIVRVGLHRLERNPFQTRTGEGPVDELAASIRDLAPQRQDTSGLIHVPVGRVVLDGRVVADFDGYGGAQDFLHDEREARVQLAAGHRRLKAFRQLAESEGEEYFTFPVDVAVLDDAAMADIAWMENDDREDISPIEEALAIERVIEELGWTQAKVGYRWGLTQGAVSNKLRLLKLPEIIRDDIGRGWLTERHGRALLPLLGLNMKGKALARLTHRKSPPGGPDDFLTVAELEAAVKGHVESRTFKVVWALDWTPTGDGKACGDCEDLVRFGRQKRCKDDGCFRERDRAHRVLVVGPEKARELYQEHNRWERKRMERSWQMCEACKRRQDDVRISDGGDWYTASWRWLCPECWRRAGLPEPEGPQAEEIAAVPIAGAPATGALVMRPVDTSEQVEPESVEPPPPPATLVTARILPGETLVERRVMVAIAEEGRPPASFRSGWFGELADLVAEVCVGYFDISREMCGDEGGDASPGAAVDGDVVDVVGEVRVE